MEKWFIAREIWFGGRRQALLVCRWGHRRHRSNEQDDRDAKRGNCWISIAPSMRDRWTSSIGTVWSINCHGQWRTASAFPHVWRISNPSPARSSYSSEDDETGSHHLGGTKTRAALPGPTEL